MQRLLQIQLLNQLNYENRLILALLHCSICNKCSILPPMAKNIEIYKSRIKLPTDKNVTVTAITFQLFRIISCLEVSGMTNLLKLR